MTRPVGLSAAIAALTLLSGCTLTPTYEQPQPAIPKTWPSGEPYPEAAGEADVPRLGIRDLLDDPALLALLERALANNQDLKLIAANVSAVRAQFRIRRAQQLPRIDGSASVSVGERSERASSGTGGGSSDASVYQVGIGTAAFELDLFGRLSSLSDAALQEYLATEAAARTARIALIAEVANVYLSIAADRSLLSIARDTVRTAERSVELTRARLEGGVAPRIDLRQAETVLAQAPSDLANLATNVEQGRNALQLLVGAPIAEAYLPDAIEPLPDRLKEVPVGLDSSILLRRPDVLQAEHQLRAANARIGAARAAFFPRISLTAAAGLASTSLSSLFNSGAFTWTVQPGLLVPIFDAGANQGNLEATLALRDAAIARYQKAIQTAFREVADALARRGTIERQLEAQRRLVAAAEDNFALVEARYRQGIESYLGTLDAQRTLYNARRSLVATSLVRGQNVVALYRALGQPALDRASGS